MANWAEVEELRSQINKNSTLSDIDLRTFLTAAENTITRFCRRENFLADSSASTRLYSGSGQTWLWVDECVSITLVEVKESVTDSTYTSWASTDWIAFRGDYKDPDFNHTPYTGLMVNPAGDYSTFYGGRWGSRWPEAGHGIAGRGVPTVRVTAKWGYAVTIPAELKEAAIMLSTRWFKRLEGAMSDALASGELGTLLYRQTLDPDIAMILKNGRYVLPMTGRR